MAKFFRNWKSTLAGVAAIAAIFSSKDPSVVIKNPDDLAIIVAGIGLIFAKDSHKNDPT